MASVRFICGTQDIHKQLEQIISKFMGTEDTILYSSCFDANAGLFETILGPEDAIISDELNHASMIEGIRRNGGHKRVFRHNDVAHLRELLEADDPAAPKLIAFESIYSMDGDFGPIEEICDLADEFGALTYIDEVHAGDIAATLGLKNTFTGDTLAEQKHPILLETIEFPEPVISVAIEPMTKADQDKMGEAVGTEGVDYQKAYEAVDKEKAADSVDLDKAREALTD